MGDGLCLRVARIMNETKLLRTPVGITALGAAALDDVTAW